MQSNVLNDLLPLVNIALEEKCQAQTRLVKYFYLWQRYVLLSLQVKLRGKSVRSSLSLDSSTVRLNIDDVTNLD